MKRLAKYLTQHADIRAKMGQILDTAGAADDGRLSADQQIVYDGLKATLATLDGSIAREKELDAAERNALAISRIHGDGPLVVTNIVDNPAEQPFASLGENLQAVIIAGSPRGTRIAGIEGGTIDPRLYGAATGGSTGVGADGGFLVQKDFVPDLLKDGFESGVLASRCSQHEVSAQSDGLEVPYIDETSRATGSRWGGVQVYRAAEADTVTATKPKLGLWSVRLEDMLGIAYLTERLMQDAAAMSGVFSEAFVDEFGFKLDDEIFRGNGAGQCIGVQDAAATVSQAKVTGQAAATILSDNVISMWARVLPRSKSRGIWVVNSECGPQLQKMFIPLGVAGQLIYMPPGGLSGSPHASLFGRPVIEIEHCSALGTKGDIAFLDLSQYKLVRKGGIKQDESIHVRFLYAERTLRWMTRVNGAPKLKAAITPYKGSNTLSPFVTLDTRA